MSRNQSFAAAFSLAFVAGASRAQSEASALSDVSTLPIACVDAQSPFTMDPLAANAAVFVVKSVQASAYASTYALERVSDGMSLSVQVAGRGARHAPLVAGATVTSKRISTGVVLTAGEKAIAFVPNALGRALLDKSG